MTTPPHILSHPIQELHRWLCRALTKAAQLQSLACGTGLARANAHQGEVEASSFDDVTWTLEAYLPVWDMSESSFFYGSVLRAFVLIVSLCFLSHDFF